MLFFSKIFKRNSQKNIAFLFVALLLTVSVIYKSRAFMVGEVIGLLFLGFVYKKIKPTLGNLIILGISVILSFTALIFLYKHDSALGRILIYKISFNMFKDHCISGIGLGQFAIKYNLYQAEYFLHSNYTIKEFLLADNVSFAFNDYWQFIIETGVIGVIIVLFLLRFIYVLIFKSLKYRPHDNLLVICISQCIAIILAALFTHVAEMLVFQIVTAIIIIYIYCSSNKKFNRYAFSMLCIVSIVSLLTFKYAFFIKNYNSHLRFNEAKDLLEAGYINSSLEICAEIYPVFKDDVTFLSFYTTNLVYFKKDQESWSLLKRLSKLRTTNEIYQKMGDLYFELGNRKQSERYYLLSVNMVPNRFGTRYSLFKYYISIKDYSSAIKAGTTILNMPVKIQSPEVKQIQLRVAKELIDI